MSAIRLHHIPGRVRLRIARAKGCPKTARTLENTLRRVPGITSATVSQVTGNALVIYDESRISVRHIEQALAARGYLDPVPVPTHRESPPVNAALRIVGKVTAEVTLGRLLGSLLDRRPVVR